MNDVNDPGTATTAPTRSRWIWCVETMLTVLLATALCYVFWNVLWLGGGLIGGDLYPYYFPQKFWLKECLERGEWPLWNPLVGFGYPVLGESQTGALYPPNLILFSQFDLNRAYVANQLGHYIVAFCFTTALGRRLGLSLFGSWLAATAFVYGWFPARICLEWSIIGGTWFVASLWAATGFLHTRRPIWFAILAIFTGLSLLAGHYNLQFITLLVLAVWPLLIRSQQWDLKEARRTWGGIGLAVFCGFCIGAVQLLPTWELKQLSQRQVDSEFQQTYGHLPPMAISQLWMPWRWYAADEPMDRLLEQSDQLAVRNATNQVEAQLYAGIVPLLLATALILTTFFKRRSMPTQPAWRWSILALVGLLFATGWPIMWLSEVPGFSFFRGPGRYSIVTVFAIAILAAMGWDRLIRRLNLSCFAYGLLAGGAIAILTGDLWLASRQYRIGAEPFIGRQVFYATLVNQPAVDHIDESPLRQYFAEQGDGVRLYAPGANIPTMLGVSALPTYLGIGPEIYETDQIRFDFQNLNSDHVQESLNRLRELGVTHLLLEDPLEESLWGVESLGPVFDPFLNSALARREPYHFYRVARSTGRAAFESHSDVNKILSISSTATELVATVRVVEPDTLIIRDLNFPGWHLVHEAPKENSNNELFRTVRLDPRSEAQKLVWKYCPASFYWGGAVSLIGVLMALLGPATFHYWNQRTLSVPRTGRASSAANIELNE